jgi:spore germination protein
VRIHTVVRGDTLRQIAANYGTTVRELLRLNELESENILVPGLHLIVPGGDVTVQEYTVQTGDTLASIAKKLGVTELELSNWTGVKSQAQATSLWKSGKKLYLPKKLTAKKTIEVNGYITPSGTPDDAEILQMTPDLTYVSMFSYQARMDGKLVKLKDSIARQAAKRENIAPLLTVTNFDGNNFSTSLAHTILANASLRQKLLDNVLAELGAGQFRGVNVDFEHMRPSDRPLYNQFIEQVGKAVRPRGYSLSIAMGPKTSDEPNAPWMGAFDYKTLGSLVDFLMLMTYEWGWVGGPPMAVAPLQQVRSVLDYATSVIVPDKILMGMSLYGYDWPIPWHKGLRAASISNNSAQNLAVTQQVPIQFNELAASPTYRYDAGPQEHEVWFDDAQSAAIKFSLVYEYGLRGISWWVLGNSFPQAFYLQKDTFEIKRM